MASPEEIETVARALRAERQCEAGEVPCPFCNWDRTPSENVVAGEINDYEVGCIHLARAALKALELSRRPASAGG